MLTAGGGGEIFTAGGCSLQGGGESPLQGDTHCRGTLTAGGGEGGIVTAGSYSLQGVFSLQGVTHCSGLLTAGGYSLQGVARCKGFSHCTGLLAAGGYSLHGGTHCRGPLTAGGYSLQGVTHCRGLLTAEEERGIPTAWGKGGKGELKSEWGWRRITRVIETQGETQKV